MTEKRLEIVIDPTRSTAGARTVQREINAIGDRAAESQRKVTGFTRDADKGLSGTARNAKGASAAIAGLRTAVLSLAAIAGAAFSMQKFVSATSEAAGVQAQLAAALASTNGVSGQTMGAMNQMAADLQSMTTYGDEAINSAQALLLTFTKVRGDVFDQATNSILDMATAMKMDLNSAALMVGKALNDPVLGITALGRSGVQFSEAQKSVIKSLVETGKTAEAQMMILAELNNQFEGSAEAARNTLGGALTALGNSWGDLFELSGPATEMLRVAVERLIVAISNPGFKTFVNTLGTVLFGAMIIAAEAVNLLSSGISFLATNFDTIAVAASTLALTMGVAFAPAIFAGIVAGFSAMASAGVAAIGAITAAMAANPLGALVIGITLIITALYVFRDEISKVLGVDIVATAKTGANLIIGAFIGGYDAIKVIWSSLPAVIGAAAIGSANLAISGIEKMLNMASGMLDGFIDRVNGALAMLPGGLNIGKIGSFNFDPIDNPYADQAASAVKQATGAIGDALSTDYIGKLAEAVTSANNAADAIAKVNTEAANTAPVATTAGNALKAAADKGKDAWSGLREVTVKASEGVNEAMTFARDVAGGFFSDLKSGLQSGESFFKSFGNAAANALSKIADKLMNEVLDSIFKVNKDGGSILSSLFSFLGGGTTSPVNFLGKVGLFAKGGVFSGGNVTPFANGGVVGSPTMFPMRGGMGLMGEDGPEAIMPLKRGRNGALGVAMHSNQNARQATNQNVTNSAVYQINVSGARGNAEIREMVETGVNSAIRQNNARIVPDIVKSASGSKKRVRG